MTVNAPDVEELKRLSHELGLGLSDAELADYARAAVGLADSYERLSRLPLDVPIVRGATGRKPAPAENRWNAWAWKGEIQGAASGPLAGKRVAIKDNVAVGGMPMQNGSRLLADFVPAQDATIVRRVLDAGGTILGKAACENLCFSGGSHTCATGPIRNPWNARHSAGGSSGGSAALVAAGEVDLAVGGDQGGSIRIPASYCGVVGHKPTHGLVPYTGAFPIETTLDHLGPMAATVSDVALFLEVIAGADGLDPRQPPGVRGGPYSKLLETKGDHLRIGIVPEGFGWPGQSEPDVDEAVRAAAGTLAAAGARVEEMSVPLHRSGLDIWNPIAVEGAVALMLRGRGGGWNSFGAQDEAARAFFGEALATGARDLSPTVKLVWLFGEAMDRRHRGVHYARARNLAFALRAAYDEALAKVDLLLMPTLPMRATVIPDPSAPLDEYLGRALEMINNTAPFDVTGHPAISVPCGDPGLPIGLMLVGKRWDDATVLRGARLFESLVGGFPLAKRGA